MLIKILVILEVTSFIATSFYFILAIFQIIHIIWDHYHKAKDWYKIPKIEGISLKALQNDLYYRGTYKFTAHKGLYIKTLLGFVVLVVLLFVEPLLI